MLSFFQLTAWMGKNPGFWSHFKAISLEPLHEKAHPLEWIDLLQYKCFQCSLVELFHRCQAFVLNHHKHMVLNQDKWENTRVKMFENWWIFRLLLVPLKSSIYQCHNENCDENFVGCMQIWAWCNSLGKHAWYGNIPTKCFDFTSDH